MKDISLLEFNNWVEKNKNLTWYLGDGGGFRSGFTPYIKYFYLSFDTRDMSIFAIKVRGWVDFDIYSSSEYRDEEGNLLDLLDRKLKEAIEDLRKRDKE